MVFWVVLALMTGAAVLTVVWPLSQTARVRHGEPGDVDFYRHQLAEIVRDEQLGLMSSEEAAAARIESGRRLIRATERNPETGTSMGEPALRRRRGAAALALSVIPLVGLTVYGALGSPHLQTAEGKPQPVEAGALDLQLALSRIEAHLARTPDDRRGWTLIAPIYLRTGRFEEAAKAYAAAIRLGAGEVDDLTGYGEALVSAAGGMVSSEARASFERALTLAPGGVKPRFYLALAAEQDGDVAAARAAYTAILSSAPAEAGYLSAVRERLAALSGAEGSSSPAQVSPEIAAMVEGLDRRLKESGGSEAEWSRLVRSLVVLGRAEDARDRVIQARAALGSDRAAIQRLEASARSLGIVVPSGMITGEVGR